MYGTTNFQITIIINLPWYRTKDKIMDKLKNFGIKFLVWLLILLITHYNEVTPFLQTFFS